jgi:hypothetical protein
LLFAFQDEGSFVGAARLGLVEAPSGLLVLLARDGVSAHSAGSLDELRQSMSEQPGVVWLGGRTVNLHNGAVANELLLEREASALGLEQMGPKLLQLSWTAPSATGLVQVFVFLPDTRGARGTMEALREDLEQGLAFEPAEQLRPAAAVSSEGLLSSAWWWGLALATMVIAALRLLLFLRERGRRAELARAAARAGVPSWSPGTYAETAISPSEAQTPKAAWEDEQPDHETDVDPAAPES